MAQGREGMEMKFTYEVAKILEKLRENRTKHEADYKKAMEGYYTERLKMLNKARFKFTENVEAKAAILGNDPNASFDLNDLLDDVELYLDKPVEYLEQYDDFIEQLEWTEQECFELSRTMFKQLVQDDWEWTRNFKMSNSKYLGG